MYGHAEKLGFKLREILKHNFCVFVIVGAGSLHLRSPGAGSILRLTEETNFSPTHPLPLPFFSCLCTGFGWFLAYQKAIYDRFHLLALHLISEPQ